MKKLFIAAALLIAGAAYAQEQSVRVFSHRGGRKEFDENTLSAFEASYKAGYRGYETDVRLTKDSVLVILHDSNLLRTTDMEGVVENMTAEEIRRRHALFPRCLKLCYHDCLTVRAGKFDAAFSR